MNHIWLDLLIWISLSLISLNKCNGICNVADSLCTKVRALSKTKDVSFKVFNKIARISKVKTLIKHLSCYCKCKFDGTIYNSYQKWNDYKYQCECKKHRAHKIRL